MKPQAANKSSLKTCDTFSLSFDGGNEIEASLLGLSISNMAFVVNEIVTQDVSSPVCHFKVKTFKKGSFEIWFAIALIANEQMSMPYPLNDAAALFSIIKGIFDIKRTLKGEKPKSVIPDDDSGYIHVSSPDGSEVLVPIGSKVVISNPSIDRRISEISQVAALNNPDGGFSLISSQESVHYDRNSVQDISQLTPATEFNPMETSQSTDVTLPIKTVALHGKADWTFQYGKRAIKASIEDQNFLQDVHSGKASFKAGDKLAVELVTTTKLSGEGIPIKESYFINKVHGHVPSFHAEQLKF